MSILNLQYITNQRISSQTLTEIHSGTLQPLFEIVSIKV
jgi:hypothetical protein